MKKSIKGKLLAFALFLGLAVIGAVSLPASAGAFDPDAVIVDYVNETITVLTDTDELVYFTDVYSAQYTGYTETAGNLYRADQAAVRVRSPRYRSSRYCEKQSRS